MWCKLEKRPPATPPQDPAMDHPSSPRPDDHAAPPPEAELQPGHVPAEPVPKRNPLVSTLLVAASVILVIFGVLQATRGLNQLLGGVSEEVKELLVESDEAVRAAVEHDQQARAPFEAVLTAADGLLPGELRENHGDEARTGRDLFAEAAAQFRLGADKLQAALDEGLPESIRDFAAAKIQSYRHFAEVCTLHQQMLEATLDESIDDQQALVDRIVALGAERDEAQTAAVAAAEEANRLAPEGAKAE